MEVELLAVAKVVGVSGRTFIFYTPVYGVISELGCRKMAAAEWCNYRRTRWSGGGGGRKVGGQVCPLPP